MSSAAYMFLMLCIVALQETAVDSWRLASVSAREIHQPNRPTDQISVHQCPRGISHAQPHPVRQ